MRTPLFEIALPLNTNDGENYNAAHKAWTVQAAKVAGGFTQRPPGLGMWQDKGTLYVDDMIPYRLACSAEQFAALVDEAFRLFPDQLAIFTARIGDADIISRDDWHKRVLSVHGDMAALSP